MPYALQGRKVLVTGGSRGLGALLCERFAQEGADVAINYNASADRAKAVAAGVEKHGRKATVIQADVSVDAECKKVIKHAIKELGGLDIVVHNAGWTRKSNFHDLDALSDEDWDKCWTINTKSILYLTRAAMPAFNKNKDGGCVLVTSSIAGLGPVGSSMAYSVSKAAGVHLVKTLAVGQGPKLRINAVCPGLLLTEWGLEFGDDRIKALQDAAVLKSETDLQDTVEVFIMAAKNSSMTGESLRVDSGLLIR